MEDLIGEVLAYILKNAYYDMKRLFFDDEGEQVEMNQRKKKTNEKQKKEKIKNEPNDDVKGTQVSAPITSSWQSQFFVFLFVSINQGFVGLQKDFGVLSPTILEPGLHFLIPYYQAVQQVSVSPQTTKIKDVTCGTTSGLTISFDQIQIVTQLSKNNVYQTYKQYPNYNQLFVASNARAKMTELCSKYSLAQIYMNKFDALDEELSNKLKGDLSKYVPGLKILDIRITKPSLPDKIADIYESVQQLKGKFLLAVEYEKTLEQKVQTQRMRLIRQAQSQYEVRMIELKKEIDRKENDYQLQLIQSEIEKNTNISKIDNQFIVGLEEIEAMHSTFTRNFMQKHINQGISQGIAVGGKDQPCVDITF